MPAKWRVVIARVESVFLKSTRFFSCVYLRNKLDHLQCVHVLLSICHVYATTYVVHIPESFTCKLIKIVVA